MHRVASYRSPVEGQAAVLYLLEHGVLARLHAADANVALMTAAFAGRSACDVLLFDKLDAPVALALLAELHAHPPELDEGWADQADPDLSRLDPALALTCPACGADLRRLAGPGMPIEAACPACADPVDLAERVVAMHGPEALDGCYPDPDPVIPDDLIDAAPLVCSACRYPLHGLPRAGRCPECGLGYDKAGMVRAFVQGTRDPG
ncbi:MAG: hypothetical protein R3B49_10620 [Phycisphaerales bacterium]